MLSPPPTARGSLSRRLSDRGRTSSTGSVIRVRLRVGPARRTLARAHAAAWQSEHSLALALRAPGPGPPGRSGAAAAWTPSQAPGLRHRGSAVWLSGRSDVLPFALPGRQQAVTARSESPGAGVGLATVLPRPVTVSKVLSDRRSAARPGPKASGGPSWQGRVKVAGPGPGPTRAHTGRPSRALEPSSLNHDRGLGDASPAIFKRGILISIESLQVCAASLHSQRISPKCSGL